MRQKRVSFALLKVISSMPFKLLATARSFCNTPGIHHTFLHENDCSVDLRAGVHPLTSAELCAIIGGGYDGAILGLDVCDLSVIERCTDLRVISRYGVGVDKVDLAAAAARGIAVTYTPHTNNLAVAELAIGLLFALARHLPETVSAARHNHWIRKTGFELTGKTLGIVGFGAIGREVGKRAVGLSMNVIAYDPFYTGEMPAGMTRADLPALLATADIITLHTTLTPETQHLINSATLMQMKDGAYLVNTARGELVDESALHEALVSGKLAGAAADVLHHDPPTDHPLLKLDNFLYTPHIGATTRESVLRMSLLAAQNALAVLRGDPCPHIVNRIGLEENGYEFP
jgi:D-3-phosphoglycerate dehydrogenase